MSSWKTKEIIYGVQQNNDLSKNKIYCKKRTLILLPSKFKAENGGLNWLLNIKNYICNDGWFVAIFQCKNLACNNLNSSLTLERS